MMYQSIPELIGNTPLLELGRYSRAVGLSTPLAAKLEAFNPAGSVKDRVGLGLILDAEEKGLLHPGSVIVEPTSGNTGIGLACVAASRGYRVILTMPETMSLERRKLLAAYGAELVLTPGSQGMQGAVDRAKALVEEIPGAFLAGQFDNPANPQAHYRTTGPEIWKDTDGKVEIFVAGVGTGGTLSGVGRYLKEQNPQVKVVGVEPADSPLLSQGKAGPHGIQGIGANFVPKNFDPAICDEILPVNTQDAIQAAKELARQECYLAGISSGAALWAAVQVARRPENQGKLVTVLLPDTGERYLSTALFD